MQFNLSQFNKIIIVGDSCSGKTTLCQNLGKQLGFPYFDLDDFHWLPNWVDRSDEEMIAKVKNEILINERWIVAGNYSRLMKEVTWIEADAIVWLKYSKWICLWRCLKRSLTRSITKEECCNGNYESFYHAFFKWGKENLFVWIYTQHKRNKAKYESWQHGKFASKEWLVFESPADLHKEIFNS